MRANLGSSKLQVPPLRYPGFPVEFGGANQVRAPFFKERRIRGTVWVQRNRKSGYAPVGMTRWGLRFLGDSSYFRNVPTLTLSSRPGRSGVEGPAVFPVLMQTLTGRPQ